MFLKVICILFICANSYVMAADCCYLLHAIFLSPNNSQIHSKSRPQTYEEPLASAPQTFTANQLTLPETHTTKADTSTIISLNQFASTLAKPLSSLIDSLNNFSKIKQSLDDDSKGSLDISFEAIDIINTLITNRLDFERLESETIELNCTSFTIRELIQKTLKIMSHKSEGKNLTLSYEIEENVPMLLLGDEKRLQQILLNLIGNAIKFTKRGGVKINVHNISTQNNTTILNFDIIDSGKGITAEEIKRIFMPYAQANDSISKQFGGTGLGLYISMQLCKLMGGEIDVKSEINKGSTFSFTAQFSHARTTTKRLIPATPHEHTQRQKVDTDISAQFAHEIRNPLGALIFSLREIQRHGKFAHEESSYIHAAMDSADTILKLLNRKLESAKDTHTKQKKLESNQPQLTVSTTIKILIADDSKMQQKIIGSMLKRIGFTEITYANDGLIALELAKKQTFDVILMDNFMPEMDGNQTAIAIRKLSARYQITPIICISGDEIDCSDGTKTNQAIFNAFLQKPITEPDELKTIIQDLVGGSDRD